MRRLRTICIYICTYVHVYIYNLQQIIPCVCVCVRACVRACARCKNIVYFNMCILYIYIYPIYISYIFIGLGREPVILEGVDRHMYRAGKEPDGEGVSPLWQVFLCIVSPRPAPCRHFIYSKNA